MSPLKQITTKMSEVANIKKNAVISLSGGMDSTSLLIIYSPMIVVSTGSPLITDKNTV